MVNRRTLAEILQTLSEYLAELEGYRKLPRDQVIGDRQVQSAVRYAFQSAIQCVLDAGLHILVDSGLATPRDNKEILQTLGEKGVLPAEFAKRIEGMAGFRNILVHRYFKVDPEIVRQHLENRLGDLQSCLIHLQAFLDRTPEE
jgi:uncharacterized protein YutE (UPF0331/DUF86 family)